MRLKSILKWHQHRKDLGVLLALLLCLKDSLLSSFAEKGFSEVADWLRVQESLKWALAGFAESWACRLWQTQLSTRTQRKENKTKVKGCKETRWFFLLIMVATGWVWSRAHGWRESSFFQRVHFQREGEFKREEFLKGQLESGFKRVKRGVSWVFNLGFLTPPNGCLDQLGPMLERLLLCCSTHLIN